MQTVTKIFKAEYRIKGSKFISFINPCNTTEEADKQLKKVRNNHPTATHHCHAFRVNPSTVIEYSQDDGEPGGTAGLPILNAMKSVNIVNTVIVVVRYYGGTNLGKSGLIDAYGKSAALVIEQATLKKLVATQRFQITYSYDQQSLIDTLKHSFTLFEINSDYTEHVKLLLECPVSDLQRFEKKLNTVRHLLLDVQKKEIYSRVLS